MNPTLQFKRKARLPMIFQAEIAECGYACVAMISNYWGHELDLLSLKKKHGSSANGASLLDLMTVFEQLNLRTRALKVSLVELHMIKCPAILHWNMNHFVVLKKVKNNKIVIHDPAQGIRQCSMEEVSQCFTGIVLEVEKKADFTKISEQQTLSLFALLKSIKGINCYLVSLFILSLIIELFQLLNPLFLQYITDELIGSHAFVNLYVIAFFFMILVTIQSIIEYNRSNMVIYLTTNLTEQFATHVVQHLLKLPIPFFEKRFKGDIQSKFQSIETIQKKISTDFITTMLDGLLILINLSVMFFYSSLLTSIVLGTLFIYIILRVLSYQQLKNQTASAIHQQSKAASIFLETLQAIGPIKLFAKEKQRFRSWHNSTIQSLNAEIQVSRLNVTYTTLNQFLFHGEHIIVIAYGAHLIFTNQLSLGMLMAFLAYRQLLINKATSFIQQVVDYQLLAIQLNRLGDILFESPELIDLESQIDRKIAGKLVLKKVCFQYSPQEPFILNDINLEIKVGERVAIIGPSGCGKTTLLKIMMGLLSPSAGEIIIDDIPIKTHGIKNYRQSIASVMQDDNLLSGSIIENIAFFTEEIDFERIKQVAKLAFIDQVIERLPMGYETLIGEMGSVLSGGQKQRLLLARALYKNPTILFLDEATSHLDLQNEACINQSLKELNITQIIIAHRPESIKIVDRVINLQSLVGESI